MHYAPIQRRLASFRIAFCVAALLAVTVAGCGSSDDDAPPVCAAEPAGGEAVPFRPAASGPTLFGEIPWPSDLYLDHGSIGPVPGLMRLAAHPLRIERGMQALDGFGRSTGALFFLDTALDAQTLPRTWAAATAADASVFFVDVDATSPRRGRRYPAYAKYLPTLGCLSVIPVPGVVLPPGIRHAAVLTGRARATNGAPLVADTELARIAALPAAQRATAVERLYGDAFDALRASAAVSCSNEVAGLAVFTTSRQATELPVLRAQLRAQPDPELILDPIKAAPYSVAIFGISTSPSLDDWLGSPGKDDAGREWPGADNSTGIAHDQIAVIASGAFVAPSFLNLAHHFVRDAASGAFVIQDAQATIPVTLTIPRRPAPPTGYPVVIYGHGGSNHRGTVLGIANEFARGGFATIGIDDVENGARGGVKDETNSYPGPYKGPDGIPDSFLAPTAFFDNFGDFVAIRENFRQTVLDQTSLVRLIQSSRLDLTPLAAAAGGSTPALDATRIFWTGGSLGGIFGAMTVAVEPEIRAAALQVPAASYIQLVATNSGELSSLTSGVGLLLGAKGDEAYDEFHPGVTMLAAIAEAGDPIAYAPHVFGDPLLPERTPPDLLVSYALYDETMPNISTVALVRAFGIPLVAPNLVALPGIATVNAPVMGNAPGGRTAGAVQYQPANHGLVYVRYDIHKFVPVDAVDGPQRPRLAAPFNFEGPIREVLAQTVTFFDAVARGGPGRIEITAALRADYDADGILDADERAHGTDPYDPLSH